MTTAKLLLPAAVLGAALVLSGCASSPADGTADAASDAAAESETRVVATDNGDITIPADPERILVLNSNLAGYLFALDIPVHAAITESPGLDLDTYPEAWGEYAEEDGTVLVEWGEDGFNFDAILAEDPDLIIAGGQGYPSHLASESFERLNQIAPTVAVSKDLLTWQDQLAFIADDVFDDSDAADALVASYDDRVAEVAEAIALPELPVGYLVTTGEGGPLYSLPETSALPQTLAEVGLTPSPVIADNPDFETYGTGDSFELSSEQVGQVLTAPTLLVFSFQSEDPLAELEGTAVAASLPAVQSGDVHVLPSWAYRADYIRTMDLLDVIEAEFAK